MAFPNKPQRRVNYRYLTKLSDALEDLGHSIKDVPWPTLRSPWPVIKEYLEDRLELRVCGWCKLPLPEDKMDPHSSMCKEHIEQLRMTKERRHNLGNRTYDNVTRGIRVRFNRTPFVQAMQEQAKTDSEPLAASIPEPPRKSSVLDILERSEVRSTGDESKKS